MYLSYYRHSGKFEGDELPLRNLRTSHLGGRYLLTYLEDIPPDDYILCITYSDGKTQLGMTGTMKRNETILEAMSREIHEETGIIAGDCIEIIGSHHGRHRNQQTEWNVGLVNFSQNIDKIITESTLIPFHDDRPDDRRKKIAVFIHGQFDDWIKFFDSFPDMILEKYISGLSLIRTEDAKNIFFAT